ncbi:hypothetical protein BKA66DRAFT_251634 [Pyrenochaeta sp. MPI-SDFR-AT-0127]|nr:hypothetical protein BKA66DRAFT_251634 [Pyrenochaeta sp. MPI-SDFR-AT-0127]
MSGLEVVAAVSAVVSAFHGGSELLKHIKKKRRTRKARDQAQQDFEERQLQDSLVSGEQQIGLRYAQDMRELGDLMRVGDVIARDRLFHIAIMMQAEVIKSLQLACQHDGAVLNLLLLHEASIMNRKDTFVTLDELKQRILLSRPMARQLEGVPEGSRSRHSTASVHTIQTMNNSPISQTPDNHVSSSMTLSSNGESRDSKHALSEYFRLKRKSNASSTASNTSAQAANVNFSEALEQLVRSRGSEDRSVIMQDIDEMISSYQGLNVRNGPSDSWGTNKYNGGSLPRQDPHTMFNGEDPYQRYIMNSTQDGTQMYNNLPPTPEEYMAGSASNYTTFNNNVLDPRQEQHSYNQQYTAKNPFPHMQTQTSRSRWSNVSATSSTFSNNSSTSSQGSNTQSPAPPSDYSPHTMYSSIPPLSPGPKAPYQHYENDQSVHSQSPGPHTPPVEMYTPPIAPLALQRTASQANALPPSPHAELPANVPTTLPGTTSSPMHMPWPGTQQRQSLSPSIAPWNPPQQYQSPTSEQRGEENRLTPPQYHRVQGIGRDAASTHSTKSDRTVTPSGFAAIAKAATILGSASTTAGRRHSSIAPSIASTDSGSSGSIGILPGSRMSKIIRIDTIQSGPAGQEKMMDGRPCKDNNYWGFCKGAWAVREDQKKGIVVRTQPSGYYNTKQIWECTTCTFQGDTFTAPHPTKKNKTETVVDPRIHISMAGIRYRWIFLAKSHVKKKAGDALSDESNYGCVICSVEGNLSSVFGGVETLMNHIALVHVADMSEKTRKKVNCILGRVAGPNEAFDINVPIFSQVEELAA